MFVEPVTLEGKFVRLEPIEIGHIPALCQVSLDSRIWRWTANDIETAADLEQYVKSALCDQDNGAALPFVTIETASDTIVGSTRFGNIDPANRKAEIGWTWVAPKWQRTAINTEAKLLMLTHAFEVWNCVRVEFKTDSNNFQSRNAIRRIGGVEEGILRNHMITESGRFRDSVYSSIIDTEWPGVRDGLRAKLQRTHDD